MTAIHTDHRRKPRAGRRTRSCFNRHDVPPDRLRPVVIGEASMLVCGDACEQLAREKIRRLMNGPRIGTHPKQ